MAYIELFDGQLLGGGRGKARLTLTATASQLVPALAASASMRLSNPQKDHADHGVSLWLGESLARLMLRNCMPQAG